MTNPDRRELVKLASELGAMSMRLSYEQDRMTVIAACELLRRLASSDGGVKGEPEALTDAQWLKKRTSETGVVLKNCERTRFLEIVRFAERHITATPADAGMREAVGWLIEMNDPPVYCVLNPNDLDEQWTPDVSRAIRFARREDAQACADHTGWTSPPVRIVEHMWPALTAPDATTKSDGGDLPANLAEIIETELTAWRGVNGGVFTIHAAALGISCAIRSAVFRANNTESDGGHGGQPYASTDAVEGASAPNATSGKQEGRTGIEVGASQTPGSSMSSGQSAPIVAGQAPGPSDPSSTHSDPNEQAYADLIASGGIFPEAYQQGGASMADDQIKHMVDRFLMWKLPEHFNPDCGISFDPSYRSEHSPVGTNLFDAVQATAMVRHMLGGLPSSTRSEGELQVRSIIAGLRHAASNRSDRLQQTAAIDIAIGYLETHRIRRKS